MASIIVLIIVNTRSQTEAQALAQNHIVEPGPISGLLLNPGHRVLSALALLALSLILLIWVYRRVMLRFYEYIYSLQGHSGTPVADADAKKEETSEKRTMPTDRSLRKILWRYNRLLIDNQTIVSTSIISPGLLPFIMLLPMFLNSDVNDIRTLAADPALAGLMLFTAGIAVAILVNVWFNALSSVMVSLDGANFNYIRSLPFSMRRYLREKWLFSALISAILPLILLSAAAIYVGVWRFLPAAILSFSVTHLIISRAWLLYDLKNLNVAWNNITDLYLRTNKGAGMVMVFFGLIAANGLLFGAYHMSSYCGAAMTFALIGGMWLFVSMTGVFFIQRHMTGHVQKIGLM